MAKISDLEKITSPSDSNVLPISDGQTTKKITYSDLKTAINSVASPEALGTIRIGNGLQINDLGVVSVRDFDGYVLPPATTQTLGGVIVGSGLTLSETGVLSNNFILPTASPTVLGGVKVGNGLTISNGLLSTIPVITDEFADSGIIVGNDLDIKVFVENSNTPTIREEQNGRLVFAVKDASMAGGYADIRLLSADLMVATGGEEAPGLVPDFSGQAMNLGSPNLKWNKIYANQFVGTFSGTSTTSTQSDTLKLGGQYVASSTTISPSTIVARDSNGDITTNTFIGNVTGNVNGNANTATQLQTSRLINGEPFNGTQNITVTASTPFELTRGNYIVGDSATFNGSAASTWNVNATSASTPSTVVARDSSGDFLASTITANNFVGPLTGNVTGNLTGIASSALKFQTPVLINGISFDGSQNVNIPNQARVDELAGSIKMWASATPPSNWVLCNGQSLSTDLYPALFSRIGYTYGGSGSFFNVPNLINKFPVGAGGLYSANNQGGNKDSTVVAHTHSVSAFSSFTGNVLPNHSHSFTAYVSDPGHSHTTVQMIGDNNVDGVDSVTTRSGDHHNQTRNTGTSTTGISVSGVVGSSNSGVPSGTVNTSVSIGSSGSSGTNANLPPYIAVYYIIKVSDDGSGGGTLQAGAGISITTDGPFSVISSTVNTNVFLPTTGGTLSGYLTLHANPASSLHAATKSYVDTQVANVVTVDNTKLPLSGGSLSGPLYLHANPVAGGQAATKNYVDSQVAQIGNYQKVLGYRHYGWGVGYNAYGDHYWEVLSTSHQYVRFGSQFMEISITPQATNSSISVFLDIAFQNQYVAHFQIRRAYGNGAFTPTITNTSPINYFAAKNYTGSLGLSGNNIANSNYTHYGRVENQQGAMERENIAYTEFTNGNTQPRTFRVAACGQWNNSATWLSVNDRKLYRDMPTYSTMTIVEWLP
jgi:microcystin-dependent protein